MCGAVLANGCAIYLSTTPWLMSKELVCDLAFGHGSHKWLQYGPVLVQHKTIRVAQLPSIWLFVRLNIPVLFKYVSTYLRVLYIYILRKKWLRTLCPKQDDFLISSNEAPVKCSQLTRKTRRLSQNPSNKNGLHSQKSRKSVEMVQNVKDAMSSQLTNKLRPRHFQIDSRCTLPVFSRALRQVSWP